MTKDLAIAPHAGAGFKALSEAIGARLIGLAPLVERLMIGLLTDGHLLVEGAPGLAKTRSVRLLAEALEARFARIQCTPDLMPADLTGTPVFRPDRGVFEFVEGPVFANLLLVDEINRAPPKVQSALLEAMAEGQVTAGGETHALPRPFMAVATQNPIEHEGTFPLPEAQLDRFMLHVLVGLPGADEERAILDLVEAETVDAASPPQRLDLAELTAARQAVAEVHLAPALKEYIIRLVTATRDAEAMPEIAHPVSPRGTLALAAGARARAWLAGRDHALPEDVEILAPDALAHRLILTWRAEAEGLTARALIDRLLTRIDPL
ncbi:MAG: AAA family ATPase [Pseudomonadota bacterium]